MPSTLDEIIYSLEKDRNESNYEDERLKRIEAKRYELTLGDEQDSLGEIKKDALEKVEVVEEKQNTLEFLDEIIAEMETEEKSPIAEQPALNEREEVKETKEPDTEKKDRER